MIHIALVDDHKVFREGLSLLLTQDPEFAVVGEVENAPDLLHLLHHQWIDLVLMDIGLGGSSGIDICQQVRQNFSRVCVLAFSMHDEKTYVMQMLEAGASGYLLKSAGKDEVFSAIRAVARGDSYFSSEVSALLLRQLTKNHEPLSAHQQRDAPLTQREREVLKLIAEEYANPEIAEKLFINIRTVDTHRRHLLEKLGVKNTAGLVKYAIKERLVD